jgi:hypothetical protein
MRTAYRGIESLKDKPVEKEKKIRDEIRTRVVGSIRGIIEK